MIRYHSFYPWHREGAYSHLMNEDDKEQLRAVLAFNRQCIPCRCLLFCLHSAAYDLYSKSDEPPKVDELKDYYQGLIKKYFPDEIEW